MRFVGWEWESRGRFARRDDTQVTTMTTTPKEDQHKYDRQLRLWGANGQRRLMNAHVCVLGSGATASETLKNLVLPGIGQVGCCRWWW